MPRYKDGHNLRDFLEKMKQTVSSYIGDERFAHDGHRYLRYLTANTQNHNKLILELDKSNATPRWEQCESLFIKVTMDQQQRINELLNLLSLGMRSNSIFSQSWLQHSHVLSQHSGSPRSYVYPPTWNPEQETLGGHSCCFQPDSPGKATLCRLPLKGHWMHPMPPFGLSGPARIRLLQGNSHGDDNGVDNASKRGK